MHLTGPGGGRARDAMAVEIAEPTLVLPQRSTPMALRRAVKALADASPSTDDLELLGETSALFVPDRFELASPHGNDASQRDLSGLVHLGLRAKLLRQAGPALRAIARSNASVGAYEWLSATGSRPACRLAPPVFAVALNMRIALPPPRLIPEDGSGGGCDCMPRFGELRGFPLACHFAGCAKQGLCNFAHDNVVATVFDEARRLGERPNKEVTGMFAINNSRPDLSFPHLGVDTRGNGPDQAQHARRGPPPARLAGMRLVADVKTVNPVCDSHLNSSARSALSAAITGERGKVQKYAELVNQQGAEFIGLGFETTGAMSPGALVLVKRLSKRADERGCQTLDADLSTWTARRWSTRFRQMLSLAVVSGVARAVIEGASRLHDRIHPPAPPLRLPPEAANWDPNLLALLNGAHALQGALAAAPVAGPSATAQHPSAVGDGGPATREQRCVRFAGVT